MGLDIIVATRNRKQKLLNLLDSLEGQTRGDFRVIVADDASDDGTREALEGRKRKSWDTTYLRQRKLGPAAARNMAIRNSDGKQILFLNDDIVAERKLVEEHLKFQRLNPGACSLGWIKPTGQTKAGWLIEVGPHFDPEAIPYDLGNLPCFYFITANILVERQAVTAAGLFDETFHEPYGEDIELGCRLQKEGLRIAFNRNAVVHHDHPLDAGGFARQQYMRGVGFAKFILKHPEVKYMPGFDIENNSRNVLRETARAVESLYGIRMHPGFFRLLLLGDIAMTLIKTHLDRAMKSQRKDQLELYTLQKLVWMYYLSKGYKDAMKSAGHEEPEPE